MAWEPNRDLNSCLLGQDTVQLLWVTAEKQLQGGVASPVPTQGNGLGYLASKGASQVLSPQGVTWATLGVGEELLLPWLSLS